MEDLKDHTQFRRKGSDPIDHPVIGCYDLRFSYSEDFALEIEQLHIQQGTKLAVTGPSGCGKTTFIKLLSGILRPETGKIMVDDLDITQYSGNDLQDFRILKMGLIFQEFELLDYLKVIDNVTLPLRINPVITYTREAVSRASDLLGEVGLGNKTQRYPGRLSQGERQRVAVCRSLIASPKILLCDEPTANLDVRNRDLILQLIFNYCQTENATLIMVTHDREILKSFDEVLDLSDTARTTKKITP